LLAPAVALVGGAGRAVALEAEGFLLPGPGVTFAGRDRFAPAAAVLASGEASLPDLGPVVDPATRRPLLLPLPEVGGGVVLGEVWWVDRFGNAQSNIGPDDLEAVGLRPGDRLEVRVGASRHPASWMAAYGDAEDGGLLVHVDSSGLIAVAVRGASAAQALGLHPGLSLGIGVVAPDPGAAGGRVGG
jgi:S-adenosylmethionine hydrolase